ncbi:sensor histidine kinase [Paenibacillus ehimensis]|uniref:Sensor histidine kinase n=1 Tax=Paenibacillus ehimensis TaxID=79264 RepID=A0ABT8V5M4_9BACL|nr:sensor histidine kinase [Paenibacillus ehimensis]MDO3676736.1 sensor histidine kinase [Paenibacillus ehimensis]
MRLWSWLYKRYSEKIQLRLTVYFVLVLVPLVIVSLFVNFRSQRILLEQTEERTKGALTSSMDYIEVTLQNVEQISTLAATNNNIVRLLNETGPELTAQSYINFADVLKELSSITSISPMVSQISLYHASSRMLLNATNGGKQIEHPLQVLRLQELAEAGGTAITYVMPDMEFPERQTFGSVMGTDSITLVRTMDLNNPDRKPNLLMITLNKDKLLDLLVSLLPSPQAQIALYNDKGHLVTGTESADRTRTSVDEASGSGSEISTKVDSAYYKWSLVLSQPKEELYRETNLNRMYTYIIIGISFVLACLISWGVYSGIASPVQRLLKGMKRVGSGNFNVRLENNRADELGYLTRAFNKMVEDQRHLIENYYEQQLQLANTELKFLQSQINPHFLYNTLDSIYWTAKNYDADEISEMVLNLSNFFRLSLSKGRETFTVEETVTHLHYYIRVQQLRFLDSFTVSYKLAEECKNVPVLKLILQPLVENAILHGLEKRRDGRLLIAGRIEDGCLMLTVQDNGTGIPPGRLEHIRSELAKLAVCESGTLSYKQSNPKDLFGLRNVMSRILIVYGKRAGLRLCSAEGEGTTATLILPLEKCKENHEPEPARPGLQQEVNLT